MRPVGVRLSGLAAVFIHCSWALPQTLLGLCVFLVVRIADSGSESSVYRLSTVLTRTTLLGGGISLGMFIFSFDYRRGRGRPAPKAQARMDAHEWGHAVQSCMLGPLYLPLVGIPSIARAAAFRFTRSPKWRGPLGTNNGKGVRRDTSWYYRGYPEAWADRIAGVDRSGSPGSGRRESGRRECFGDESHWR